MGVKHFWIQGLLLLGLASLSFKSHAQSAGRVMDIKGQLETARADIPGLNGVIEISVSDVPLDEFLRSLALANDVNLVITSDLDYKVVNNFKNIKVIDVLIFFAEEYPITIDVSGTVIRIGALKKEKPSLDSLSIVYQKDMSLLSFDLKADTLAEVAREIARRTPYNLVFSPELSGKRVSLYVERLPAQEALDQLAWSNDMTLEVRSDSLFSLVPRAEESLPEDTYVSGTFGRGINISVSSDSLISLSAGQMPLSEILSALTSTIDLDFFMYEEIQGVQTINVERYPLDRLLNELFYGTEYTYRSVDSTYFFGRRQGEGLRITKTFVLENRSAKDLKNAIPESIQQNIQIEEFIELNALIISGDRREVEEVYAFLEQIDRPVPMVIIEVMIVDYNENRSVETGIEMGVGQEPAVSGGQVFPEVGYTLNGASINNLIQSFSGGGLANLGYVNDNFYMTIRALEEQGVLNVRSTPKLSTLNGHEASLKIGDKEYYVVENQNIIGSQNPQTVITRQYNSVQANLEVTITPYIAGRNEVTLNINVTQSNFTARIAPDAPPGEVSRNFTSMIRVMNGEMVLLGGLEEVSKEESSSGVPVLSRIPILEWFFSSKKNQKSEAKLNIFIKPTLN